MCGIIGAVANHDIVPELVGGLQKLEYRGYDSCGIAVISHQENLGKIESDKAHALIAEKPDTTQIKTDSVFSIKRLRTTGRVSKLLNCLISNPLNAQTGIAHTRWATHGQANECNAHPHISDQFGLQVSVVHNGIIENQEWLRIYLDKLGYIFSSQTDTEAIAHWLNHLMLQGHSLFEAVQICGQTLDGSYTLAAITHKEPKTIIGLKNGAPLLLGISEAESTYLFGEQHSSNSLTTESLKTKSLPSLFLASDVSALPPLIQKVVYLENKDVVKISSEGYTIVNVATPKKSHDASSNISSTLVKDVLPTHHITSQPEHNHAIDDLKSNSFLSPPKTVGTKTPATQDPGKAYGLAVNRPVITLINSYTPHYGKEMELGRHRHFMQKEIAEQPESIANTISQITHFSKLSPDLFGDNAGAIFAQTEKIIILGCGSSLHAGYIAKQWIESLSRIPVNVEVASEFRFSEPIIEPGTLVITVSQSGETADTIAALRHAQNFGIIASLCICNVPGSALLRESDLYFLTAAGVEIGVAATKSFTTQLVAFFILATIFSQTKKTLSISQQNTLLEHTMALPEKLHKTLTCESAIQEWATVLENQPYAVFLGRGIHLPVALEGALKLKEIAYIPAQGYPIGELKHGPLALIMHGSPVIISAPNYAKLKSSAEEILARSGVVLALSGNTSASHASYHQGNKKGLWTINLNLGETDLLAPIHHTVALQLLAYHTACLLGTDIDKPRNLAKSVTVE